MKKYILDANIIFSALISGKQLFVQLFETNLFYTPDFVFVEIEKYKNTILKKSKLEKSDFQFFVTKLFQMLTVIPSLYINDKSKLIAVDLCNDIDLKDVVYVALSVEMQIPLVTRDIPLYEGLKRKGFENVILLDDLIKNELTNIHK